MSNPVGMPDPLPGGNHCRSIIPCYSKPLNYSDYKYKNSSKKYFESYNSTNKQKYFVTTALSNLR